MITYLKSKEIDLEKLYQDILETFINIHDSLKDIYFVEEYRVKLPDIIDKHAPILKKEILAHPNSRWFAEKISVKKRLERKKIKLD